MSVEKPYRLPTTVTPERYEFKLTPDLTTWTFTGDERISIHVHEPVREIILNAAELELYAVSLQTADGKVREGRVNLDAENERATLSFAEPVPAGRGDLQIQFSGILNDKLHGFYRSTYKGADGQDKPLASTQFESTDARRAFPCWDEPAFKAVYQVTLVVDEKLTAISNARVVRENALPGNKKAVVFADSMKMSTYLVAFIVGEFEASAPVMVGNAPLRVCAVPGKKHLATFAVDIGKASLEHFSAYYGIAYPGDKLDLIAIPDFASGAMENLGAITFRETALLVDADRATRTELERVADVVSHENAHMWFGDLVTMKWWNGLWLNEAFATFMEMLAVDAWKPEWRRWARFTVSRAAAMQVDGLKSTRPIEFPVERPEEAAGMFDILTYEKGASVLRMLEQYLGADAFRNGIRLYLRHHAYANAETTDLWDALEESTGQPVRALMDTWIFLADGEQSVELGDPVEWAVVNAGGHGFYRVRYGADLFDSLKHGLQVRLSAVERFSLVNDTWASTLAGLTSLIDYLSLIDLLSDENDVNVWTTVIGSGHHLERILDDPQCTTLEK